MKNHYCFAKYTCLDLCHVKLEFFDAPKAIDLSFYKSKTCVQTLLYSLNISVQFTEEICLYLGKRLERDLMQDGCVPHLCVLPGPGLPARDEPLEGEHQL